MRKLVVSASIVLFLASGLMASPAQAANNKIVNGVSCSKLNATTKGKGNESYKCAKNPYYKKTKKTWRWIECLNAQQSLLGFKSDLKDFIASGAGSADDIASDQGFIDDFQDATKEACKRGA